MSHTHTQLPLFSADEINQIVDEAAFEAGPMLMVNESGVEMCIGKCEKELCKSCCPIDSPTGMFLLQKLGYLD
jgi:hypothetical protein